MSKTRTTTRRPHRLAPGVGGGGYLANLEFPVKSFFSKLSDHHHQPTRRSSAEPAASRETTETSQAIFPKKKRSSSGAKYLEALANLFSTSGRAASTEAFLPGQPPFSFLFSWRPRPLQSAKIGSRRAVFGAPQVRRDSIEAAELSDPLSETQAPKAKVSSGGPWPRSEGRLLEGHSPPGKRGIVISSPGGPFSCA